MAKVDKKRLDLVEEQLLSGKELKKIRSELYKEGYHSRQIDVIVVEAKKQLHEHVAELKDILPDLNLHRLNQLYVSSVNASPRDRAAIVKEMNQMIGVYNQTIDLDIKYNFVINGDDDVEPLING